MYLRSKRPLSSTAPCLPAGRGKPEGEVALQGRDGHRLARARDSALLAADACDPSDAVAGKAMGVFTGSQSGRVSVLVTDGSYKHAVGIIRCLGRAGQRVSTVSSMRAAPGFFSRFTQQRALVPNPSEDPRGYIDSLKDRATQWEIDLLIPVGFASYEAVSHHHDVFADCGICVVAPSGQLFDSASDKLAMTRRAAQVGIKTPESVPLEHHEAARDLLQRHGRVVVKPRREGFGQGVLYVESIKGLGVLVDGLERDYPGGWAERMIVQEYIPGQGSGYMALAWEGRVVREFAHRRRREWPPSGGAATAAESTDDPELLRQGRALVESMGWHGPAMVEFRYNPTGYYLMEFNPKFWGSLELALAAGADFPGDLCRLAAGEDLTQRPMPPYKVGLRFWWPWRGDLRRLFRRPGDTRFVLKDLVDPRVRSNWSWTDPLPNIVEIGGEVLYPFRRHQ